MPSRAVKRFDQSDIAETLARAELLPEPLPANPMPLLKSWYDEVHVRPAQPNPNGMTLATVDPDGRPSARVVLCKELNTAKGYLVFFTNYEGRKGVALDANPRAAAVFWWDALDRQVRIEGPVARSPKAESDAYFASRPWESRVGAWASRQSRPVESRAAMLEQVALSMKRLGLNARKPPKADDEVEIPRPGYWGGFRLWVDRVELWAAGAGRLHDRAGWTRTLGHGARAGEYAGGEWQATRLQP